MKERPILFSALMVSALLAGTKTQTRRVAKGVAGLHSQTREPLACCDSSGPRVACPYGQPGDRLWVREAWRTEPAFDALPPRDVPRDAPVQYEAGPYADVLGGKLRPSIFLPRWACRLILEITGVRVEQLQGISRGDAMAEGCPFPNMAEGADPRQWYAKLWSDINGPGSWEENPWVWVIEFRKRNPEGRGDGK